MGRTIGIDLGTTNSCVAAIEGDRAAVIAGKEGSRTTPSVVAFAKDGQRLVGEAAKRQASVNADRTIVSVKREMGTDWRKTIDGHAYTAQEISAAILMKLKKDAEDYLGEEVTDAVITVPAYFNDAQRQATKDAGRIAGLNVRRIINEPTAAALSYGLDHGEPQTILVYDLGGGTFDVSIIRIGDGALEVMATAGDNRLGGDDWDKALCDYLVEQFRKDTRIKLAKDPAAYFRVMEEAEKAKKALSSASVYQVNLPFIAQDRHGPVHMDMTVSRAIFEDLTRPLVQRTEGPMRMAIADAGLTPQRIDKVLLVGGSTRMPAVYDMVKHFFGKEPSRSINPDECVALGAAVQGGKLAYEVSASSAAGAMVLLDVTPLSLSVETVGGVATRLIDRNTTIPTRHSQIFTTTSSFQRAVEIKVYQGERQFARDNKFLGSFRLEGIRRAPRGVPQIEVTFDIDANGIVQVSAKDLGTGHQQQITIAGSSNMSEEEINRAREDARRYESEDARRQEIIDIRNRAEAMLYTAEKVLEERKGTLEKMALRELKADVSNLKKVVLRTRPEKMTDRDAGEIREAQAKLERNFSQYLNMNLQ
ncbi:MAG: molecular chaperone DnaK [Lachnospiraceae bacterium]|nr:molecular chaperone DnaK [Lachnospiraceae bacterium]